MKRLKQTKNSGAHQPEGVHQKPTAFTELPPPTWSEGIYRGLEPWMGEIPGAWRHMKKLRIKQLKCLAMQVPKRAKTSPHWHRLLCPRSALARKQTHHGLHGGRKMHLWRGLLRMASRNSNCHGLAVVFKQVAKRRLYSQVPASVWESHSPGRQALEPSARVGKVANQLAMCGALSCKDTRSNHGSAPG